jgi:hypothetical protein
MSCRGKDSIVVCICRRRWLPSERKARYMVQGGLNCFGEVVGKKWEI